MATDSIQRAFIDAEEQRNVRDIDTVGQKPVKEPPRLLYILGGVPGACVCPFPLVVIGGLIPNLHPVAGSVVANSCAHIARSLPISYTARVFNYPRIFNYFYFVSF